MNIPQSSRVVLYAALFLAALSACKEDADPGTPAFFQLQSAKAGDVSLSTGGETDGLPIQPVFTFLFSSPLDTANTRTSITLTPDQGTAVPLTFRFEESGRSVVLSPAAPLAYNTAFTLALLPSLRGAERQTFAGLTYRVRTANGRLQLTAATLNRANLLSSSSIRGVAFDTLDIALTFSEPLPAGDLSSYFFISPNSGFTVEPSGDRRSVRIRNSVPMDYYRRHQFTILPSLVSASGFTFQGFSRPFVTGLNPSAKMPLLSDEALLTKTQEFTFKYFWDFAHPVSGLARERNSSGDIVTIGGSGFGLMAIPVGIERGFITRTQGIDRISKIVQFLAAADRFHGVWPHWMNGNTGRTVPFSTNDDGGDLVETAFMAQGLITVRQYLNPGVTAEAALITSINSLLDSIEWSWYTRGGQQVLYWHWSATKGWAMNMQIKGYNEALIVYLLAASSKNYAIQPSVYTAGWASNGGIRNNKSFYGIQLPVGYDYGGPLFFAHYSFLGLDPRGLSDTYANYWTQNVAHSRINYEHCVRNPARNLGYSAESWGLTASDNPSGYGVHEPTRDPGTISPTAALSSMPYTPEQSMAALRHFYHVLGNKLWGPYGFYDAFNPNEGWVANSYLAIDQGPIVVMIENHRTGLLWNLFMAAPEVSTALQALGFQRTP